MIATFLDTSYLLALVSAKDMHHARALVWEDALEGTLVTSEYVLLELADALAGGSLRSVLEPTIEALRQSAVVEVVAGDAEVFQAGRELFTQRKDKAWGLTDCISFVIMERRGIREALTADHHFEQAGYKALLRHEPQV